MLKTKEGQSPYKWYEVIGNESWIRKKLNENIQFEPKFIVMWCGMWCILFNWIEHTCSTFPLVMESMKKVLGT